MSESSLSAEILPATASTSQAAPRLDLGQALIDTCLAMNASGINQGTSGNVSVRLSANRFLITPSGVPYERLNPADMVEMDLSGGYYGDLLPSTEWRMHHAIYEARPQAGAVVHTHSTYCTALSALRIGIPRFHYMIAVAGGDDIRCADYATFGTEELAIHMMTALQDRSACLLANHGMICFGPTLSKALWLAVEVETLARQFWAARQIGDPVLLSPDEIATVLGRFKSYGKQAGEMAPDDPMARLAPVRRGSSSDAGREPPV